MSTNRQEVQTPREMVVALRNEMISLKAEETSLKQQIVSLNEQFQALVKAAAERYPEILDEEFSQKAGKARVKVPPSSVTQNYASGSVEERSPRYTRHRFDLSPHRRPAFDVKRFPRRFGHEEEESSGNSPISPREQFENHQWVSGIDARKIRSSLPNSPTDESEDGPNQENLYEERRKRLKKKMVESRKVDVVHLGLF